jgi:tryptophanyl-tRNA synthetase
MSKSYGSASYIALNDSPETIQKKLASAVTDSGPGKTMSAGVANLFALMEHFSAKKTYERFTASYANGSIRYSDLKETLARDIAAYFTPFRKRREALRAHPSKVFTLYTSGATRARAEAKKTLTEVMEKVGLA